MNSTLKNVSTKTLIDEISTREGVVKVVAEPYENKTVTVNGPAIILTVTD